MGKGRTRETESTITLRNWRTGEETRWRVRRVKTHESCISGVEIQCFDKKKGKALNHFSISRNERLVDTALSLPRAKARRKELMLKEAEAYDPMRRRDARRRFSIERMVMKAVTEIETKLPADERLTNAQVKLNEAFELLADYYDKVKKEKSESAEEAVVRLRKENDVLRGIATKVMPCHYCGAEELAKCPYGFPGCSLADDLFPADETQAKWMEKLREAAKAMGALIFRSDLTQDEKESKCRELALQIEPLRVGE